MKASYEVTQVSDVRTNFGESPFWCAETRSLYYVDIFGQTADIFRYDFNENTVYAAKVIGESIATFIIPIKGCTDQFAVGFSDRVVKLIRWDGRSKTAMVISPIFGVEQDPMYASNHWHMAKADPKGGRLFGGTFRQELCSFSSAVNGSFYRYTKRKGAERIMGNIKASCGLEWNTKTNKFYYIDGCKNILREYDWNPKSGKICEQNVQFNEMKNTENHLFR